MCKNTNFHKNNLLSRKFIVILKLRYRIKNTLGWVKIKLVQSKKKEGFQAL